MTKDRIGQVLQRLGVRGLFWGGLLAGGISPAGSERAVAQVSPEQAGQARRTIVQWLECQECGEKELEAVRRLGQTAVPTLTAALQRGPSPGNLELLRRHLTESYRQLKQYERTHPEAKVMGSEKEYVATYTGNYIAQYQTRAATALGAIGGPEAEKALEEAQKSKLRDDVALVVSTALKQARGR
jgi:hypothetical protein